MRPLLPVATLLAIALFAAPATAGTLTLAADYTDVVDISFPTEDGVTYSDTFDAPRSGGRIHQATDLMGAKLLEVYAAMGGTINWIPGAAGEPEPGYGYMVAIDGDDGREYSYVHLNNDTPGTDDGAGGAAWAYAPGLQDGSRVERGQWIGWMGDSGNAEGVTAHLHFSIEDPAVTDPYGQHRLNPYASLLDAEERGDYATEQAPAPSDVDLVPEPVRGTRTGALDIERIAGPDRIATAVALSQEAWESAGHVVLAPAYSFAEAVVAGPLAATVGGPVLTTAADGLDDRVAAELDRLGTTAVTVVGGDHVLSAQVVTDLEDLGLGVDRLAGEDQAGTAAAVAGRLWALTGQEPGYRRTLVALGSHPDPARAWPDALTAGWHGAVSGGVPVLFVRPDDLPEATRAALDGVGEVTIVGGEVAVSARLADLLADQVDDLRRLHGNDRYATALAVARDLEDTRAAPSLDVVWAATGTSYADALAAAPAVARAGQTFVLLDGTGSGADGSLDEWCRGNAAQIRQVRVLGGPAAVSAAALEAFEERLAG